MIEPFVANLFRDELAAVWILSSITAGDLLADHAVVFAIHTSLLVLVKGVLDSLGSYLLPDKSSLGYGFACDGPGRGGTCDISSWDSFYLATFWTLNTIAWDTFHYHYVRLSGWSENTSYT